MTGAGASVGTTERCTHYCLARKGDIKGTKGSSKSKGSQRAQRAPDKLDVGRKAWYRLSVSLDEKIRETIIPSELGGKPLIETKRETEASRKMKRE